MAETHEARIAREEEEWTGPKLIGLMVFTLIVALSVIYTISSLKSGDYSWCSQPHDELSPSASSSRSLSPSVV